MWRKRDRSYFTEGINIFDMQFPSIQEFLQESFCHKKQVVLFSVELL